MSVNPSLSPRLPLSVFIIAQDEADRIVPTIESVIEWVDEVIVIDSGSKDGTVDKAAAAGARVIYNPWPGYGAQKRFGEDHCRNSWVLNIDADERVTPELAKEIQALFSEVPHNVVTALKLLISIPMRKRQCAGLFFMTWCAFTIRKLSGTRLTLCMTA